jgi:hypothetical protein
VQQIYERATAELSAVKAGLLRRDADPLGGSRGTVPTLVPDPAPLPSPPGGGSMKAGEADPEKG